MFRTIFSWLLGVLLTVIFGLPALFVCFISHDWVLKYFVKPYSKLILMACGVKVRVEVLENLPQKEPCIIMYNHQSMFDIFAFAAYLPINWRAVMKREIAFFPFFGWVARLSGHFFVRRDGSIQALRELDRVAEKIRSGTSVLIAPEGTRSKDGKLLPFKRGAFLLAMRAGVPVVPMAFLGSGKIMSKNSRWINPGEIEMRILSPIDVNPLPTGKVGREELSARVRTALEKALSQEKTRIAM